MNFETVAALFLAVVGLGFGWLILKGAMEFLSVPGSGVLAVSFAFVGLVLVGIGISIAFYGASEIATNVALFSPPFAMTYLCAGMPT